MKRIEHMDMSQRDNFNKAIVGYINDNLPYIRELAVSIDAESMAKASLDHYNATVESAEQKDGYLSDEQKEHFLATAKRLFEQGFVEWAGSLNG